MKEVEMVIAAAGGSWMPNLTLEQSAKSEQIFMAVNSGDNMTEVVSATATELRQSRKRKGNRGVKDVVPPAALPSSSKRKSRKRKFRKFKKKSKKPQTLDITSPMVQDAGPSHSKNTLEHMHLPSKAPMPSPDSSTEIRLAALKAMLLQAKGRDTSTNLVQKPLSISAVAKPRSAWLKADLLEDIARRRVASPELSVPPADDYWGILNYEKRNEKMNMESLDLFLCGDLKG